MKKKTARSDMDVLDAAGTKLLKMEHDPVLAEALAMDRLGFSLHWLHPRTKRPIGNGWQARPRRSAEALILEYKVGMNLGWRLGLSKVSGFFIHALDIDVKSTSPRHAHEAVSAAEELLGADVWASAVKVKSGRAPGLHVLVALEEPYATVTGLRRSSEKVKVSMSGEVVERPAWEIDFLGRGKQFVAPGSTHPDTGKRYQWEGGRTPTEDDFLCESMSHEMLQWLRKDAGGGFISAKASKHNWPPRVKVSLDQVPPGLRRVIVDGFPEDSEVSRAILLLPVAKDLMKDGLGDHQTACLLSDPEFAISEAALKDNRGGGDPADAYRWTRLYVVNPAREELKKELDAFSVIGAEDASGDAEDCSDLLGEGFDADGSETVEKPKPGRPKKTEEQKKLSADEELRLFLELPEWEQLLTRGAKKGENGLKKALSTPYNALLSIQGIYGEDLYRYDEFSDIYHLGLDLPMVNQKKKTFPLGEQFGDPHIATLKIALEKDHGFLFKDNDIVSAVTSIATQNGYHPIRTYMEGLVWDKVPRMDTAFIRLAGTEDNELHRAYSRIVISAMVQRIFKPGCKFDYMLILEGPEGVKKSSFVKAFATEEKYFLETHLDMRDDKACIEKIVGKHIIEQGEMTSMNESTIEKFKAFLTRQSDRTRLAFGKGLAKDFPRQSVFIGTVNSEPGESSLVNARGLRRFWSMAVTKADAEELAAERDQLFAEAVWRMQNENTPLYLPDDLEALARKGQRDRIEDDPWFERVKEALRENQINPEKFTQREIFKSKAFMDIVGGDQKPNTNRLAKALQYNGFKAFSSNSVHYWVPKIN